MLSSRAVLHAGNKQCNLLIIFRLIYDLSLASDLHCCEVELIDPGVNYRGVKTKIWW